MPPVHHQINKTFQESKQLDLENGNNDVEVKIKNETDLLKSNYGKTFSTPKNLSEKPVLIYMFYHQT